MKKVITSLAVIAAMAVPAVASANAITPNNWHVVGTPRLIKVF